jgi:hypothetical protein
MRTRLCREGENLPQLKQTQYQTGHKVRGSMQKKVILRFGQAQLFCKFFHKFKKKKMLDIHA